MNYWIWYYLKPFFIYLFTFAFEKCTTWLFCIWRTLFRFIFGFRIPDSGFRIPDSRFRIPDSGFRIPDSGFRIPVFGFRFPDSGFRLLGLPVGFESKFLSSFLYLLTRSLTIFGSAGIWADNLCPASQWKCWKCDIRSSVFNNDKSNTVKAIIWRRNENSVTRSRKTRFRQNLLNVSTLFTAIVNQKKPHFLTPWITFSGT